MLKRTIFSTLILIFISIGLSRAEGFFYQSQDPKSYVSHVRFQYNTTWQVNEIDAKAARNFTFFQFSWFSVGFMGGIQIYLHPTDNFWGYYPVDNLIGSFGLYSELTNFGLKDLSVQLYLIAHESSHLVDGYSEGTGNLYTDRVFDSNEYTGFDMRYAFGDLLKIYAGFIYYLYLGSKTPGGVARPLIFRVHAGEDFVFPVIPERMNLILTSDFALFYERRYHTAVNIGAGLDFGTIKVMFHYENQYGLGQDFSTLQNRLGLEFTIF